MTKISASQVKELRERTGLGMMECKKALIDSAGDIETAIDNLRKNSGLKAAKKAGRTAGEGIVVLHTENGKGVMIEVNCETDFVARDTQFMAFAQKIIQVAATKNVGVADLMQGELENHREELVQRIGENISLRRVAHLSGDRVVGYVHSNNKIGVLVALEGGNEALGKDLAMHVAATAPQALCPEQVPSAVVEKEKALFIAQAEQSGKPPEIVAKMIQGRINKFLAEISFTKQSFVKDPDLTIEKLVANHQAKVTGFIRYEAGEGIEKASEDFAEEVRRQAGL